MLESNWFEDRPCLIVCNSNRASLELAGCSHPIWILEGILNVLCLSGKDAWDLSILREIRDKNLEST
jgi:hypothetical protein